MRNFKELYNIKKEECTMTEIDFERQMENLVLKLIKDNDSVDIHDRYTI